MRKHNQTVEELLKIGNAVETHTCQANAKHMMARDVQDVTRQTILRKYAEARADRPSIDNDRRRDFHEMCQDNEERASHSPSTLHPHRIIACQNVCARRVPHLFASYPFIKSQGIPLTRGKIGDV